jgi:hypothetical protein
MARKKSSRGRGNGSNPNTVLVIFMVFFILLSIGLGVTTYYGYAGQKKFDEDAKGARAKEKAAQNGAEYYKFQALLARAAVAEALFKDETTDEKNDLQVALAAFDDGSKFQGEKTRAVVDAFVKANKAALGWNAGEKKFATTWADKAKKLEDDLNTARANNIQVMDESTKYKQKLQNLQTDYDKYWDAMKKSIDAGNTEALKAARARTGEMDNALARNDELVKQLGDTKEAAEKAKRLQIKALDQKKLENEALAAKLKELEKEVQELRAQEAIKTSALVVGDFAGKWSGMIARGGMVELDIKADGLAVWSVPGIGRDVTSGVSRLERSGDNYVLSIQDQQVRLYLASDRRTLRLAGGGVDSTLTRK